MWTSMCIYTSNFEFLLDIISIDEVKGGLYSFSFLAWEKTWFDDIPTSVLFFLFIFGWIKVDKNNSER